MNWSDQGSRLERIEIIINKEKNMTREFWKKTFDWKQ